MTFPVQSGTSTILSVDSNLIQDRVRDVLGISTSGYGISALSSRLQSTGTIARASHFNALFSDLDRAFTHQTGGVMNVANTFSSGTVITTASVNYLNTISEYIVTNRYTVHPSQTTASVQLIDPRISVWDGNISSKILCSWTSALQANYFFNSGGALKLQTDNLTDFSNNFEEEWIRLIDSIGTYTFTHSNWVSGLNSSTTYNANSPFNFSIEIDTVLSDRSVEFTVKLNNNNDEFIVYPQELQFALQDGSIVAPTISTSVDVLQDSVFTLTNVSSQLKADVATLGFDVVQS